MKKFPMPWYRPSRGLWYVTLDGIQHNLGPDKEAAFKQYKQLLVQPEQTTASCHTVASIVDAFLDWSQKHQAERTYFAIATTFSRSSICFPICSLRN